MLWNIIKQLPVGKQVLFAFGTLCALFAIIGGLFFWGLRSIERSTQVEQARALNKLAVIDDRAQDVGQFQAQVLWHILASDPEEIRSIDQGLSKCKETNDHELADYQKFIDTEKEKELYARVLRAKNAYWEQTEPVLVLSRVNRDAEATKLVKSTQAHAFDEFLAAINALIAEVETEAQVTSEATAHFIAKIRMIGDALIGLTILVIIGIGFGVAGVARQLNEDKRLLQSEISERKQAEVSWRQSEEKFRQLADNITDVFWICSPDFGTMHFISPGYQEIWGRSTESLYAHPHQWIETILPEERQRVVGVFATLMAAEPKVSVEYRIARPDGTIRWVHDRGFQVRDAAGVLIRLAGLVTDITERKRFEAQLSQSQKLETVGKLAGGIAHEFNSILTAIIGQSELLLGDLPAGSPLGKNAIAIQRAAGRAATLTRQLLAYGRKQTLLPEILDLNSVLSGMESTLRHLLGRGTDARLVHALGLKAVKADAGQIEEVIMNLAMNAADAMPQGGKFTLETANVTVDQEFASRSTELKAGEYVMLAVSDTGAGMSEEVRARAFEPFFTTKGVGQGTGLGLSTCYGIIKQSGGHISVYSELGRGTTFKVYLPQVEPETKAPLPRLAPPALPRGTETILLVEDDPDLRVMATTLLTQLGYTVLAAANGIEALTLKQQRETGHIDLLFTDVVMPHMSGKELADRVRASNPHTRTLFTSAYTENTIVHQGVLDKGVALLPKPFTPSALAHKLREVLDQPDARNSDTA